MQKLIHTCQNATSVYRKGSSDNESLEYAPDHQLSCWLSSNPEIGFIIFEVAFSQILQNARNKARDYLCRSEKPQPKVVVILNFESRAEEMFFARMKVHFEVHRQDPANAETTKIDQQGVSNRDQLESRLISKTDRLSTKGGQARPQSPGDLVHFGRACWRHSIYRRRDSQERRNGGAGTQFTIGGTAD